MIRLNVYKVSSWILSISLLFFIVFISYLLYPVKVFETSGNSKILTPEVKAGESVWYKTSFCKYYNLPGRVSKTLVNDTLVPFTPYFSNVPKGCRSVDVASEIPKFVPPGDYFIRIIAEFEIGPLKVTRYEYRTENFKVI